MALLFISLEHYILDIDLKSDDKNSALIRTMEDTIIAGEG